MTMRRYIPRWEAYGISPGRYDELRGFCIQYPEWKTEAASLLGVHGQALDGMPHGASAGDPVAAVAARRDGLLRKIQIIDDCAMSIEGGRWYAALIQNVCMKKPYASIDTLLLPTSNRNSFFAARKAFFLALDKIKGGISD